MLTQNNSSLQTSTYLSLSNHISRFHIFSFCCRPPPTCTIFRNMFPILVVLGTWRNPLFHYTKKHVSITTPSEPCHKSNRGNKQAFPHSLQRVLLPFRSSCVPFLRCMFCWDKLSRRQSKRPFPDRPKRSLCLRIRIKRICSRSTVILSTRSLV